MVAVVAGLILLAPYGTLDLSFEAALKRQALVILAATTALLLWGLGRAGAGRDGAGLAGGLRRLWQIPPALRLGLILWSGAALIGGVVGLSAGYPPARIAGQVLSMGLLPLAAVAGFALEPADRPLRWLPAAVVAAVTGSAVAHLADAYLRLAAGYPVGRLYFANSVSAAGPSLLALLLALALLRRPGFWWRALVSAAILILGAYMLGSGVRGLILVSVPAVLFFLAIAPARRHWRVALALALVAGGLLLADLQLRRWDEAVRPSLVPGRGTAHLFEEDLGQPILPAELSLEIAPWTGGKLRRVLVWHTPNAEPLRIPRTLPVTEPGLYRLAADIGGQVLPDGPTTDAEEAEGCVGLWWLDADRAFLGALEVCVPPGPGWRQTVGTGLLPEGTVQARVVLYGHGSTPGRWRLKELRLERLGDAETGRLLEQLTFVSRRLRSALDPLGTGSLAMRGSAAYRLEETRTLWRRFVAAPLVAKVFGHGLGASYTLDGSGAAPLSSRLDPSDLHYIHNFYLFLLFKLGLLGGAAALAALGLWLGWLWRAGRRAPPGHRRALLAALLAAWVAYCLWSVASPEILNFRLAPLWGLSLALAAALDERSTTRPADEGHPGAGARSATSEKPEEEPT